MIDVIFLSIVQGVTEFLPISSSAHLIIVSKFLNFNNGNLTLDISLHLGSLLAIIFYFKKDLFDFINNKILFLKILLSSIPVIIFGFFLIKLNLIDFLRSSKIIGWTTIIFGLLLYFSDLVKIKTSTIKNFKYSHAFFVGLFQMLSLVPGVSRSGITITAARFLNYSRVDSAKISFLISIPTLCAVSFYNLQNLIVKDSLEVNILNFWGMLLSFFFSYFTIKFFLNFIKNFSLKIFVVYRLLLGLIILFFSYS
jgi:undecaprenyl-diphosphatase